MELFEMLWAIGMLGLGGLMIDLLIARRSGVRAFLGILNAIRKIPMVIKFLKLLNDPNFEKFVLETIDSIQTFNELMKKVKKGGIMECLKK